MSKRHDNMAKNDSAELEQDGGDAPLIDLNDASIKKLIARAKKRGVITYDELNEALPSGQMDSDQIEDITSALSEMGINIVEAHEDATEEEDEELSATAEEEWPEVIGDAGDLPM